MKVTLDISEEFIAKIEEKVGEILPNVVEEVLNSNLTELVEEVVQKQLKSCALIYIQSPEFRTKMMDKVKPVVNQLIGIE